MPDDVEIDSADVRPDPVSTEIPHDSNGDSSAGPSVQNIVHDEIFYFDPVIFKVGNTLFKVPKGGLLVPGSIFEVMFALPAGDGSDSAAEGSSDDNPIELFVDEEGFRTLLMFIYPPKKKVIPAAFGLFGGWVPASDPASEAEFRKLVSALNLATSWDLLEVRQELIDKLTPLVETRCSIKSIAIARKYRVAHWLSYHYSKLIRAQNDDLLDTMRPADDPLDWETIAKLMFIKNSIMKKRVERCYNCGYTSNDHAFDERTISSYVEKDFRKELESMVEFPAEEWAEDPLKAAEIKASDNETKIGTAATKKKKRRY